MHICQCSGETGHFREEAHTKQREYVGTDPGVAYRIQSHVTKQC